MRLAAITLCLVSIAASASADPLTCDLSAYRPSTGLTAVVAKDVLTAAWQGDREQEVRLRLGLASGAPIVRQLAVRPRASAAWQVLIVNATPEYSVVTGYRRMSNQQIQPLRDLKVPITPEVIEREKWNAFWDAPLFINPKPREGGNPPPSQGIASQPGTPRQPEEIKRASASFRAAACSVTTNGARLEITFSGLQLGVFSGRLQFTAYRGTNLIRMEAIAQTTETSVAYKYDAGLKGVAINDGLRMAWRDTANTWQEYAFGGSKNDNPVPIKAANRTLIAETRGGSLAAFPPPHTFFWAREIETNLGYVWYRKDGAALFSFGVRQAEREEAEEYQENFALYSAPPGSWQRMAMYFYASAERAAPTLERVLAFTHGDKYKPLPGYQVMAHHYHMDLGQRLRQAGSLDAEIPDLLAIKSIGINIVSQIDSVFVGGGGAARRADPLEITAASVEGARRHSDKNFLVMPDQEVYGSPLGGHTDLLFSHPVYWTERAKDQAFVEEVPKYGTVYHVSGAEDFIEMARRENILISMPHPRTKGSTGYPDAVKDEPFFADSHYHGVGFRWGMGLDLSEQRLCESRCLKLLDDMSNWTADKPGPPKYLVAITETRYKAPGDDVYAASPVNYVKLDEVPKPDNPAPVIDALMHGDSFVTSGEVLIDTLAVQGGSGASRVIVADLEWTFPLEFVEVVWGDGTTTDRQIIPCTQLPPLGQKHFEIPFDATGKKWVRFAAWDSAGNGATSQPIKLKSN